MENNNYQTQPPSSNNSALIAVVSVLAALVLAAVILGSLFFTGVINFPGRGGNLERTMYVVENAYMRSEASDTSTILISLSPGAAVTYHKDANSIYASVTYVNSDGIFDGYLEKAVLSATKPNIQEASIMYVANVKHSIYFRSAPVEQPSNIITEILLGTPVTFIENTDGVFAKISYNNQEGYVKREYLSPSVPYIHASSAYDGNTSISGYRYVANVKNSIYLRSQPVEDSGNVICEIPLGTQVGFIEYTDSTFSKISYNGSIGYAKTEYLSTSYSSSKARPTLTVCNVKTSIYLRSTPEETPSNIITEIPVGSVVEYMGDGNNVFSYIRWNGYTGYAKNEYLR